MNYTSLKLSFTNIQVVCSSYVHFESFFKSNSPDILPLCETNLEHSIDSRNFYERCYLPLIQKYSVTWMHRPRIDHLVYVKKVLPFVQDLSIENSEVLIYVAG